MLPFEPVSTTARGCDALRKALRDAELEVALGDRRSARVRALETASKLRQALDYVDDPKNTTRLKKFTAGNVKHGVRGKHRQPTEADDDAWSKTGSEAWGGGAAAGGELVV